MAKPKKQGMFIINVQEEEAKCTESQLDILLKIHDGQYRLVKKKKRSSVWNVYREIARPDGTKLKWRYYCLGCKRVMQSTGGTTSNLRIHKCHVRYLKQRDKDVNSSMAQHMRSNEQWPPVTPNKKTKLQLCEELDDTQITTEYSDEDDYEEVHITPATNVEQIEQMSSPETIATPNERPLLKLFSDDETWSPDITEEQPIEIENVTEEVSPDFRKETIRPHSVNAVHNDANAISEAESYAKAWSHAFLKLSDEQKFYAKRSIDELLVLGRLERLNISTVTSLTTNL